MLSVVIQSKQPKQPRDFYILVSKSYLTGNMRRRMAGGMWGEEEIHAACAILHAWCLGGREETDHKHDYNCNAAAETGTTMVGKIYQIA